MLFSVEQAFVGRDEKRAPLKTPAWEASACGANFNFSGNGKGRADLFEEQAPFLALFKFRSKIALFYFK